MTKGARLGQHFLTARWAAVSLARAVAATPDETILEIGPIWQFHWLHKLSRMQLYAPTLNEC